MRRPLSLRILRRTSRRHWRPDRQQRGGDLGVRAASRLPMAARSAAGMGARRHPGRLEARPHFRWATALGQSAPPCASQRVACGAATLVPFIGYDRSRASSAASTPCSAAHSSETSDQSGPVGGRRRSAGRATISCWVNRRPVNPAITRVSLPRGNAAQRLESPHVRSMSLADRSRAGGRSGQIADTRDRQSRTAAPSRGGLTACRSA